MKAQDPLISIIIVNYCGKDLLEKCLHSLSKTDYKNYEVIFIDNCSNDDSIEFVKKNYTEIQVIQLNKNYGFAAPNNIAAKVARGKYLVFLNNDTEVTPGWLGELVKELEMDISIAMAQSLLMRPDGTIDSSGDFIDVLGRAYSNTEVPKGVRYILSPRAACMIIKKDIFLDLGGFDESYFASYEDVELGWKAWLWGYKVCIVPTSVVQHVGGQTIKEISEIIAFHSVKNSILLRLTNFDFPDSVRSIFLMSVIMLTRKVVGVSLVKDPEQGIHIPGFKTILKAFFWILKNSRFVSKKRKILKSRKVRTNEELKRMGLITPIKN